MSIELQNYGADFLEQVERDARIKALTAREDRIDEIALQVLLAKVGSTSSFGCIPASVVACDAYQLAQAMLAISDARRAAIR